MVTQEIEIFEQDPSQLDEGDLDVTQTNAVVTATDWTTETILGQLRRGNIELTPRFQRREAWTDNRKSAFIESLFWVYRCLKLSLRKEKTKRAHISLSMGNNVCFRSGSSESRMIQTNLNR